MIERLHLLVIASILPLIAGYTWEKSANDQMYQLLLMLMLFCLTSSQKINKCSTERERECVCVVLIDREGSRVFTSTVLVVVWMAMYLTSYVDYLTSFHEPLLPCYTHHAGLKNV